jgi:hypothetical protein
MSETPRDYPNIRAMASGTISGAWREWPLVRPEAKALLAERDTLRAQLTERDAKVEAFGLVKHLREQLADAGNVQRTLRAEVERLKIQRDAALVHGPEDMVRALEEQRTLVETLEGRIKGLHRANDSFGDVIARDEQAEAALRDCWAVMDASKDARERELARKMRLAILHAPAPAEQLGSPELRRVMGMGIPFEEQIESPREEKA